jgi:DNA-binding HxlR family transcriptional regulator
MPQPPLTPITPYCSIERSLAIVGERWSFLVLREVLLYGESRFADIQRKLGIASNVLTDRLDRLVDAGVLEKRAYREQGARSRFSYHPTQAGIDLKLVLAALQQWGDQHEPRTEGPTVKRTRASDGSSVSIAFVADDTSTALGIDEVAFVLTDAYPTAGSGADS